MRREPVLILGGRSDIGLATARAFARRGHPILLAARDAGRLAPEAADIRLRFAVACGVHEFDVRRTEEHRAFLAGLPEAPGIVVSAVGTMGGPGADAGEAGVVADVIATNFGGPAVVLALAAADMAARGGGTIVGISSVAGERGRASNLVYGAAKAGFTAYLSGLRNAATLAGSAVRVVTVKPGYVATRMTEGMALPARLTARPEDVAEAIVRAVERRRDVVHVRWIWRPLMALLRVLPEGLFKRLDL